MICASRRSRLSRNHRSRPSRSQARIRRVRVSKRNVQVRKGQAPEELSRDEFRKRFFDKFADPAFATETDALQRVEVIAWDGYSNHRKAPRTHPAGPGYADPSYDLS